MDTLSQLELLKAILELLERGCAADHSGDDIMELAKPLPPSYVREKLASAAYYVSIGYAATALGFVVEAAMFMVTHIGEDRLEDSLVLVTDGGRHSTLAKVYGSWKRLNPDLLGSAYHYRKHLNNG